MQKMQCAASKVKPDFTLELMRKSKERLIPHQPLSRKDWKLNGFTLARTVATHITNVQCASLFSRLAKT
nr:MAG TPA: hypothetical protein [Bacteriophage sp.]